MSIRRVRATRKDVFKKYTIKRLKTILKKYLRERFDDATSQKEVDEMNAYVASIRNATKKQLFSICESFGLINFNVYK